MDFALRDNEYSPGPDTDMLLHFNRKPLIDEAGRYRVSSDALIISDRVSVLGKASGGFSCGKGTLSLKPGRNAMFEKNACWGVFSIEFWLYPALLDDGEMIFSWTGSRWQEDRIVPKSVSCSVWGRKLRWYFEELFSLYEEDLVSLTGITPLLPRDWRHHLLRYDSTTGDLEYLVDGIPEGIVYISGSGREPGSLF